MFFRMMDRNVKYIYIFLIQEIRSDLFKGIHVYIPDANFNRTEFNIDKILQEPLQTWLM